VAAGAIVIVILLLLIGGLAESGVKSRPFLRSVNRSYASQARAYIDRSNTLAATLSAEVPTFPDHSRASVQVQLDDLVSQTEVVATRVAHLVPPSPQSGSDRLLSDAMAHRAVATAAVRAAIFGLLQMHSAAIAGAPGALPTAFPSLDVPQATAALTAADDGFATSNTEYGQFRAVMAASIGHPSLPRSVWTLSRSAAFPSALAQAVAVSTTLAPVHDVVIAGAGKSQAIRVEPSPVPSIVPAGSPQPVPGSPATVPPTRTLSVTVTVSNLGNVDEPAVLVGASLSPLPGGTSSRAVSSTRTVALVAGSSRVVAVPTLEVVPGTTYILDVSVRPPPGERRSAPGVSALYQITVAPLAG